MSKPKNFITDPVSVLVSGRKLLIAFIVPIIILAGERIKTDELVEQETDILDQLKAEEAKENPDTNLVERLTSQLKLPDLLSRYESNGFKAASFRLIDDDEAAELNVKRSKSALIKENEELKVQVAELEAALAETEEWKAKIAELEAALTAAASAPESKEKPKKKEEK